MPSLPTVFTELMNTGRTKQFPKDQIIFYEGDITDYAYVLKSGRIKIYDIDAQGNEKILHIVKPPSVIPFAFFTGVNRPLNWFYAALTDCEVSVLSVGEIQSRFKTDGDMATYFLNTFAIEMHELLVRLSSMSKTNVRDKVFAALRFLAHEHADTLDNGWCRVSFPVNHQLIADITGITRESATAALKELRDDHVILNPRMTVLDINISKLS